MKSGFVIAALAALIGSAQARAEDCLRYGAGQLEGRLVVEKLPSTHKDGTEPTFFVLLDPQACFQEGRNEHEPALQQIAKIQLLHPSRKGFDQTRPMVGRHAYCKGTLFGKWTEHHRSAVVIQGVCFATPEELQSEPS